MLAYYEIAKVDPGLGETLNEIAFMRAKLQHWLESFASSKDTKTMQVIREYAESITHLVERRHKMMYGEQITITMRHYQALVAQLLAIVGEVYGDSDDRYATVLDRFERSLSGAGADTASA